jgi:hypothetical protein
VPILIAFIDGAGGKPAKALDRLAAFKSTGPAAALLATATRVLALNAAHDAYRAGALEKAQRYLQLAKSANAKTGADELALDLAVLDLDDGKLDAAIAQLERSKLPEALANLGVAYDRKGEHGRALDAWRRARKAGVRFAPLADWIAAKERIYGDPH